MLFEVLNNLAFSLGKKAETPFITDGTSCGAQGEGNGIPGRVKRTGVAVQLFQALFTP